MTCRPVPKHSNPPAMRRSLKTQQHAGDRGLEAGFQTVRLDQIRSTYLVRMHCWHRRTRGSVKAPDSPGTIA